MPVTVEIPTILRTLTDDQRAVEVSGSDVAGVLAAVNGQYSGFAERVIEDGQLRKFINVYLNDEDVRFLAGLATDVADGDVVTILPAVAGG
ncbi:MAG: MoaD/ThiS family protein [Actinomycetia bacterium]|nr:MoaD/ThiS family protein [Actinomycetes bacterium]MCH9800364.1 MoaD/ThiS family protein [Actinomycetes bacterium]